MPETLLSPSNVVLIGRVVEDLNVVIPDRPPIPPGTPDPRHGPFTVNRTSPNRFLEDQLGAAANPQIARIYGFSYEGRYYDLPWPAMFLVHGPGEQLESQPGGGSRVSRAPEEPDHTGMAAQDLSFADDLMAWSYDRADLSIRMDVDSGTFEQILLDLVFGGGGGPSVSGVRVQGVRVSGVRAHGVRVSGVRARGGRDGDSGD